jgi:hypothetical protein
LATRYDPRLVGYWCQGIGAFILLDCAALLLSGPFIWFVKTWKISNHVLEHPLFLANFVLVIQGPLAIATIPCTWLLIFSPLNIGQENRFKIGALMPCPVINLILGMSLIASELQFAEWPSFRKSVLRLMLAGGILTVCFPFGLYLGPELFEPSPSVDRLGLLLVTAVVGTPALGALVSAIRSLYLACLDFIRMGKRYNQMLNQKQ